MQNLGIEILLDWLTWKRLVQGLYVTLEVAFFAIIFSLLLGTILGVLRTFDYRFIKVSSYIYLSIIRILPTLVLLYILYYTLPSLLNIEIDGILVGVIAFTLWGTAEMSDIVRSAIISLPQHQSDSALAIGLSQQQAFTYILLPQAFKNVIPPSINLAARIIMTTAFLSLIGVRELVRVGKEIIEANAMLNYMAPFWIYGIILLLFFAMCYSLSRWAKTLYD
ncbi:ABC transporter permease subunit [Neisseriaceae bacterium PsAf]|nr:ABC transporter permease subunit [Neisseriaceae bacterium PsAf]